MSKLKRIGHEKYGRFREWHYHVKLVITEKEYQPNSNKLENVRDVFELPIRKHYDLDNAKEFTKWLFDLYCSTKILNQAHTKLQYGYADTPQRLRDLRGSVTKVNKDET